jgi:hypothetical protein
MTKSRTRRPRLIGYHGTASLGEMANPYGVDEIEQRHRAFMALGVTACFFHLTR